MSKPQYPWQTALEEARQQTDIQLLRKKVAEAETAIVVRLQETIKTHCTPEESAALKEAVIVLRELYEQRLNYPRISTRSDGMNESTY